MTRRTFLAIGFLLLSLLAGPGVTVVEACPMCKLATESDNLKPRAYMYSILFMLTAIGSVVTVVSVGLYKISQREQAALEEMGYGHVLGKEPADRSRESHDHTFDGSQRQ